MKYKLSDICDVKVGFPFKSELFNENGDGIRLVRGMNVSCAGFRWGNQTRWWNYYTKDLEKYLLKEEDVLIAMDGNVSTNFVQVTKDDLPLLLVQRVARLRAKNVPQKIVWYIVKSHEFGAYLDSVKTGTTISHISAKQIGDYEIDLPDYLTQEKISSILSILDDKIRLNNKINNNLMQQAKTIFEAEIVNRAELPNGWKKSNLASIANYLNGLAMQNYRPTDDDQGFPVLKIKELRQGACDADSERCSSYIKSNYIVNDGDVIFSWSGSLLVDFWCGGICGLNQHLFKVTSTQYAPWFFYSWTNYHLAKFAAIASAKATTMGHIKRSDIEAAEVIIPSPADYERIGALIQPLYDLCVALRLENRKLAATRDSLLPRLLSGEIDISEAII